jgi:hypothetical protein
MRCSTLEDKISGKNRLLPSSGLKREPNKYANSTFYLLNADFMLSILLHLEDCGDVSPKRL